MKSFFDTIFKNLLNLIFRIYYCTTGRYELNLDEFFPLVIPAVMYFFGGDNSLGAALKLFLIIILFGGFIFGVIGWNAGHHHPEIVHDGDAVR